MTTNERIATCQLCTNKQFNAQTGIVCGLTNEKPTFESACEDYVKDEVAVAAKLRELEAYRAEEESDDTFGLSKYGVNSSIVAGFLLIIGAVLWFVLGIILIDRIFFYPPIMAIFGIIAISKGIQKNAESKKRKKRSMHQLDAELDDL